jgi:hypothetical protein
MQCLSNLENIKLTYIYAKILNLIDRQTDNMDCTCNVEQAVSVMFTVTFLVLRIHIIVDAPWYVPNTVIGKDLQTPTVKEEIHCYSSQYSASLSVHPDNLAVNLMAQPENRRLRRHMPKDLPTRY